MQPTMEILARINQNSMKNKDEIFTRMYRYLLREDIYFVAYKNLYANKGAATKGVDDDTADGFSYQYISNIINSLKNDSYFPKPVRRTHIQKKNGKLRPLGIPVFADKLVQEVIRMILEAVYEPIFLNCSHGFRPKRSCHTALKDIRAFNGTKWFVEGDIKGCFDNIEHEKLLEIISRKIKDHRFMVLIRKFLKAGYMEGWKINRTYSGTPQGGIISPILSNIYLNELDCFILNLSKEFNQEAEHYLNRDYKCASGMVERLSKKIDRSDDEAERGELIRLYKEARKKMQQLPCKSQTDKKLKYVRYADDFIVGVNGSREDSEWVKARIKGFINQTLKMELSDEKTLITHSSQSAKFLGYHISVRRDSRIKPDKNGMRKRSLNNMVQLTIPFQDKIEEFLFSKKAVRMKNGRMFPAKRDYLLNLTDLEIVSTYSAEMRGIFNYYNMAVDYYKLSYFSYLMEYSCLMTLARKHKSSISKIMALYKDGHGKWGIPYETKKGNKRLYLPNKNDCKDNLARDAIPNNTISHSYSMTSFEKRLHAKVCELCGASGDINFEIHHVNKVKNLKGKSHWEMVMIAKRRKTLVVCESCHKEIHR